MSRDLRTTNLITAATRVVLGAATARTTELETGDYRVVSTVACFIRQGGSAVNAVVIDTYLPADRETFIRVTAGANAYLAGITGGGAGAMTLSPMSQT